MGRRKQYMDDGSDSSDDEGGRIAFDITDRDLEEEAEGFYGSRKRKRFVDEDLDEEEEDNRGGLGSSFLASKPVNFHTARESPQPTRDPAKERVQKEAKRSPSPAARPDEGFASFSAHSKGFGQKMLEKMGWKMGQGLGASGEGIVNPIETKLRPARMGMGFRGFDERTEQAKEEARLRGESVSDEEEEDVKKTTKPAKREAWKSKAKKPKTVFRTAMDIIAEAELREAPMLTQQKVIDMTGPQVREVSLSEIRKTDSPTWMETTTRLPELRHNLRLIVDLSRGNLEKLSKEKHMNTLQIKAMEEDIFAIRARMEEDKSRVEKAKQIQSIARELEQLSKSALVTGAIEHSSVTALYGPQFQRLEKEFRNDIKTFNLDALVVAVWAPLMKYQTMRWDVLANPTWSAEEVAKWRLLLRSNDDDETNNGYYGSRAKKEVPTATPYEMMMNNIWLTKVRSAINNNWNVRDPDPIVQLLEAWKPPILPRFIFENIVNQLVLPKIVRAVSDWDPRSDPEMIHVWIHPWLPALEAWRLADLFVSIRHKLSVVLRQWHPSDESAIHILIPWKDVWTPDQMEAFLVKSILPKLTRVLRYEFEVNPRDQKLEPLIWCLAWKDILSETILGQLVENEFFNKWLDMLYKWLTLDPDRVDYDEVREWYLWWRQVFSSYGLNSNKSVAGCFRKGLDMMSMAANGEQVKRN